MKSVDVYEKDDEDRSATSRRGKLTPLIEGSRDASSEI